MSYAVTANHVAAKATRDQPLSLRMNLAAGGTEYYELPQDRWFQHDKADVAIARVSMDSRWNHHHLEYPYHFPDEGYLSTHAHVGVPVYFVGLFSEHPGKESSLAIARFGNVALLPGEPLDIGDWPYPCYLVEARSWGGQSGSPAVFYRQSDATIGNTNRPGGSLSGFGRLLGIVTAHYPIPQPIDVPDNVYADESGAKPTISVDVPVNSGIAVVVPAAAVAELLTREDVVGDRESSNRR